MDATSVPNYPSLSQRPAELEQLRHKLELSEAELRQLIDVIPHQVCVFDENWSPVYANQQEREYTGLALEQARSKDALASVIHPEDREGLEAIRERAQQEAAPFELELRLRRKDGQYRWFLIRDNPLRDEHGRILRWFDTRTDIEDRKRAEDALQRSRAYLTEAQSVSHTGSIGWNITTDEHIWSEETFRIFEYDPSTKITLPLILERIHPDDRTITREMLERAAHEQKPVEYEHRLLMPDGSVKHLRIVARCAKLEPGTVEFIGAAMDVTAARRAEAELQEAQAELARVTRVTLMGELAASIAHEVNQPLAGVVTSANAGLNWLAKDPPNLLKTREAIERILRDGTRAGEVLNRIRNLLKKTPLTKSPVGLNQIIRDVLALTASELRQNNVELSLALDSKLPAIIGDSVQLQQVLLNLIMNAVEAMASAANRRKILRVLSESGSLDGSPAVSVKVSDTGIGLSAADAGRLFEAFHTTKPKGMGMGLWISRSIIESHGGRLTAQSNDGPGATFQVLLPADTGGPV